jgi:hypothetical protein
MSRLPCDKVIYATREGIVHGEIKRPKDRTGFLEHIESWRQPDEWRLEALTDDGWIVIDRCPVERNPDFPSYPHSVTMA